MREEREYLSLSSWKSGGDEGGEGRRRRWRKVSEINETDGGDDCQRSGFPNNPAVRVQSDKNMLGFIYGRQSALF